MARYTITGPGNNNMRGYLPRCFHVHERGKHRWTTPEGDAAHAAKGRAPREADGARDIPAWRLQANSKYDLLFCCTFL